MKHAQVTFDGNFEIITGNDRSQAAMMILGVGEGTGGPDNRHQGSDQWLYVAGGEGVALVEGQTHVLRPGTLILIERGEAHEIRNEGREPLHTLNFYVPPTYAAGGGTLPSGEG